MVFVNHATQQSLRIRTDGGVDGLGDPSNSQCEYTDKLLLRVYIFKSLAQRLNAASSTFQVHFQSLNVKETTECSAITTSQLSI